MEFTFRFMCVLLSTIFATGVSQDLSSSSTPGTFGECPCNKQPEGVVIPHPTDCRAYYRCLGGLHTMQSQCAEEHEFFHPYIRACTHRSQVASFAPDFIPTKDICKITALFPSPVLEDFATCIIKYDESVSNDSSSDELLSKSLRSLSRDEISINNTVLGRILNLFPSLTANSTEKKFDTAIPTPESMDNLNYFGSTRTTTTPTTAPESCKLSSITIQHFPGPCKASVTCENGLNFMIENCQSSLSLT